MELLKHLSQRQYIDGEWVESANKNTRDIINPYNQEVILWFLKGQRGCRTCNLSCKTCV